MATGNSLARVADADIQAAETARRAKALAGAATRFRIIRSGFGKPGGGGLSAGLWQPNYHPLLARIVPADNPARQWGEEWNRLEIYLPERVKEQDEPCAVVSEALAADFAELESFIAGCGNPPNQPSAPESGHWRWENLRPWSTAGNQTNLRRRVRQYLSARQPSWHVAGCVVDCLEAQAGALEKSNGDVKALRDGRADNGRGSPCRKTTGFIGSSRRVLLSRRHRPAWRDLLRQGFSRKS